MLVKKRKGLTNWRLVTAWTGSKVWASCTRKWKLAVLA